MICERLSEVDLREEGGIQEVVDPEKVKSSIDLIAEIKKRRIPGKWIKEKLSPLLPRLKFDESYLPISTTSLSELLRATALGLYYKPDNSRYIPEDPSLLEDLLFYNLAVYGPEAPSPINAKGTKFPVPPIKLREDAKKDTEIKEVADRELNAYLIDTKAIPKTVILVKKPIDMSHKDWVKVVAGHPLVIDEKERARGYRNLISTEGRTLTNLMKGISMLKMEYKVDEEEIKKRKREEDGGSPAKRAKTGEDLLGLLGIVHEAEEMEEETVEESGTAETREPASGGADADRMEDFFDA